MNQKRFSILDLEEQAKHHEEIARALRLVLRSIKIEDTSYALEVERADSTEGEIEKRVRQSDNRGKYARTTKQRAAISRRMKAYYKHKNGDK